ncbi:CHAT domain-containing protein [Alkalinema pantanalense CENA528]|uniref:CHAT domain-containing protein n=1 Tax=Alkalinema pantanalense TaxID=1620705 RepID=UPI003D6F7A41
MTEKRVGRRSINFQHMVLGVLLTTIGILNSISPLLATGTVAQTMPPPLGNSFGVMGLIQDAAQKLKAGQFKDAITLFEQAVQLSRKSDNFQGECLAIGGIANTYTALGQYDRATSYYQEALTISRKHQMRQLEAIILGDLAQNYSFLGQYEQALAMQLQGLQLNRALKDQRSEVVTLNDLGNLYVALGNDRKAETYFREGLAIAQQANLPSLEATIFSNLGSLFRRIGNYEQAMQFQQQALERYQKLNNPVGEMTALGNLGSLAASQKNYKEALRFYEKSLQLARQFQVSAVEARMLINLAYTQAALKNWPEALHLGQQGFKIATQINNQPLQGLALTGLSEAYLRTDQLSKAEATIQAALPILDKLRLGLNDSNKITLIESQSRIYQLFQEVSIRQNRPEVALEAAERGRARAFVELLTARHQAQSDTVLQSLAQAPKINQIRQIAKTQNATLVQYSIVGGEQLYIWVIKPTGEVIFRSTQRDLSQSLAELVSESRFNLGMRGRAGVKIAQQPVPSGNGASLDQLYQFLIAPIAQDLPSDPNQRVIFLPQGELFLVPFAALPDNQGRPLIERHTISTAPSIQTLSLTQTLAQRPKNKGSAVIVGDPTMPTYNGEPLTPLSAAREEAIAIGQQLNTPPLIGAQATKAAVLQQMPSARLLHFATHGLLDPVQGDIPGAIALTPSGQDNGFLSAAEIFNLKLNADLVVLSACDTGRGDITGDGVVGLSRSFIAAGAPSVVVSLWAVNDQSTSEFMQEFYRQLKQQPDKAQALRQAMLITRQRHPDPIYWAAFTLVGEAR